MIARANRSTKKPIKAPTKKPTAKSSGNVSKTKATRKPKVETVPEISSEAVSNVAPHDYKRDTVTRTKVERDAPGGPYVDWGGKHHGKAYSEIDAGYLNWMIKSNHRHAPYAATELRARQMRLANPEIILSPEAIDEASMACRVVFAETRKNFEGLHTWLIRVCKIAIEKFEASDHATDKSITCYDLGLKFRFKHRGVWLLEWIAPVNHPGIWWGAEQQAGVDNANRIEGRRSSGRGVW